MIHFSTFFSACVSMSYCENVRWGLITIACSFSEDEIWRRLVHRATSQGSLDVNSSSPSGHVMLAEKKTEAQLTPGNNEQKIIYGDVCKSKQELRCRRWLGFKPAHATFEHHWKQTCEGYGRDKDSPATIYLILVVMATQPEARALGWRGGNTEREGCWEERPSVWLPHLSFHACSS